MVELWNASHVPANLALQWSRRLPKRFLGGDNRPGIDSQFSGSYWLSDIHAHLCCVWRNSAFRKDVTFFIDSDVNIRMYYYGESFIPLKKFCEDRNYTFKHAYAYGLIHRAVGCFLCFIIKQRKPGYPPWYHVADRVVCNMPIEFLLM